MASIKTLLFMFMVIVVRAQAGSTAPTKTVSKITTSLDLAQLPSCAYSIFQELATSPCSPTDAACICRDGRLMSDLNAGIARNCNSADKLLASSIQSAICTPLPSISASTTTLTTASSSPSFTYTAIEAPIVTVTASAPSTSSGVILTDSKPLVTAGGIGTSMTTKYNFSGTVSYGPAGPTTLSDNWAEATLNAIGIYRLGFVVGMMGFMAVVFSEL